MRFALLLIAFLSFVVVSKAGDTLKITKPIALSLLDASKSPDYHLIKNQGLIFPFTPYNGPLQYLKPDDNKRIEFSNTYFYIYAPALTHLKGEVRSNPLVFGDCYVKYLNLGFMSGDISFVSDKIGVVSYDSAFGGVLSFNASSLKNVVIVTNAKELSLSCQFTSFTDTAIMRIVNSHISGFQFACNPSTGSNFQFFSDTLTKGITFFGTQPPDKLRDTLSSPNEFHFDGCFIDAPFNLMTELPRTTFDFYNCTFGPHADLSFLPAHKVMFRSCRFISTNFPIGIFSAYDTTYVSFINTDVEQTRMNYTPQMHLWFDTSDSHDLMENSYIRLIEKYKKEGKSGSLQAIDIQYKQFKEDKIINWLDKWWWNYGYDKWKVLRLTSLIILCFFALNLCFWKPMQDAYPIIEFQSNDYYYQSRGQQLTDRISRPLLFTFFVFFSLRVEFNKLNLDKLPFVTIFLFQYTVGVGCLLFIAKAVFNI
ncbi:MAG TPA: hypothetical protein VFE32_21805 [Puia sp.]|nr:hypothetical protein [Puia sp.]